MKSTHILHPTPSLPERDWRAPPGSRLLGLHQLSNFLIDHFVPFRGKSSLLLFSRFHPNEFNESLIRYTHFPIDSLCLLFSFRSSSSIDMPR